MSEENNNNEDDDDLPDDDFAEDDGLPEGMNFNLSKPNDKTSAGFVALIGAPNAGKSTLVNKLVGIKVSIVTHKVQTTRTIVRGVAWLATARLSLSILQAFSAQNAVSTAQWLIQLGVERKTLTLLPF